MGIIAALIGLLGGSLVPLASYRLAVPFDEPDRDACLHCGRSLSGPGRSTVGSWVRLPSRCFGCRTRLGPPAWLTAAVAAITAGLLAIGVGPHPVLILFVPLAVLGVLLGAIDLACQRLPHLLVLPAIAVSALGFLVLAAATGAWADLGRAALASLLTAAVYAVLYLLPGRAVGLGDVTLGALLGGFLGWLGWSYTLWGLLLPWLVNLPVLLTLMVRGRIGRKTTVPFGPAMLIGAILAVLVGSWLDRAAR